MINDGTNQIICCAFLEQAQYLLQQTIVRVDMSFKRVYGEWKEIIFADFLERYQQRKLVVLKTFC
jgi:thiamine phosphate synthase YjbQ (UPF0047 family)